MDLDLLNQPTGSHLIDNNILDDMPDAVLGDMGKLIEDKADEKGLDVIFTDMLNGIMVTWKPLTTKKDKN